MFRLVLVVPCCWVVNQDDRPSGEREFDYAASENRYDHLLNYYGADDKLAVANRHIGVSPVGDDSRPGTRGVWEMYRYDALGRRVQTYSVRGSACPSIATECASYFERTVWDGDQLLYEIRTPVTTPTNDLAGGGTYGSFGRVAYLHGGGIDAPLAVTRFDEAGQPAVQTLAPHANWQGDYVDGTTMSGGAVATCTGASGCPRLEWRGGKETADGAATAPGDYPWWGRLVVGQLDGSGLKYQRNRFYDPLTGQFTQADPIGLAGGKNLYAFAGGDPVNYTDPFGLCPPVDKNTTDCSPEMKRLLAMDKPLESPLVDPVAIASGSITGLVRGTFVKAAIRVAETSASPGIAATTHGAMRLADPARLGTAGVRDAISNATRSFTQKDGAQVFAQQVGSRLNVVVQGERGVITTFRNLSDKSLARLAKNYGWEPK